MNFTHSFKDFDRFFVGFDRVADKMANIAQQSVALAQNYPPFNVKKVDENKYTIEMALAGFAKQDIDIELTNGSLIVSGKVETDPKNEGAMFPAFIYKGISSKPFKRTFTLADNVEIKSADLANGILKIWLEALTPESSSKKIDIKETK